ncbi:FtsX-like permease family protein [Belliella kenyensis]|uniref:FtsX-like permease family protein n=1 Tax=Belliella kenyensis TaxID=1472724 RepID=A0ABV8EP42_9BACT|nr:FtsX-like permease family protein [Belliella kenyensis]MCH7402935.1 ABC transporter permease [Belliella kenyensis]MDN3602641.1 ABC transporter permease [Belliella kenyensis]
MWKNYLLIAFRNIRRNKLRTFVHIFGLSLGVGICLLIFQVVLHAFSFDRFHSDVDRIFRIHTVSEWQLGEKFESSGTSGPLGEVIDEELAFVETKGRLYTLSDVSAVVPEQNRYIGKSNLIAFADQGFMEIFDRVWLAGNPETALSSPFQAVISESSMRKYFPGLEASEVLGKEMLWIDAADTIYTHIHGVVKDYEELSDFVFKDFISFSTIAQQEKSDWYGLHSWTNLNSSSQLFVKLAQGTNLAQLDEGLGHIASKYLDVENNSDRFSGKPLLDMHFSENFNGTEVSLDLLRGLVFIGVIIMLLACLNFVNLETALAIKRAKEVGIRKTLGSDRKQLMLQFLSETFLLVIGAACLAVFLADGFYQLFSSYLPETFEYVNFSLNNGLFLLLIAVLVTCLSGIYPAVILSGYQPQRALKGEVQGGSQLGFGPFLRKNLTVIQFTASITFICMVLVLRSQLQFVSSQPLGFDKDAVMYVRLPFMGDPEVKAQLTDRLRQQSSVSAASLSNVLISSNSLWTTDSYLQGDTTGQALYVHVMNVDSAFVEVHGLNILAGKRASNKVDEVLVNRNFLHLASLSSPEDAIGMALQISGEQRRIVGVLDNFNARNLREEILPMVFIYSPTYYNYLNVKLAPSQNLSHAKLSLEAIVKEVYPYESGEFLFIDEAIEGFYEADRRIQGILGFASGIAILISILGLFGLSSFTIAQRSKEVSIRKVLGAGVTSILMLISKQYIWLVFVSTLLAIIPAYYFSNQWLKEFAYKIDMPYAVFGLVGLAVLGMALTVVFIHSLQVIRTNPAKVLKSE